MSTVFCWECGEPIWEEDSTYFDDQRGEYGPIDMCPNCSSELSPDTVTSLTPKELAAHVRAQTITEIAMTRGRNETTT